MKAKLHKMVSGYILSLNGDIDDPYAIVNEELAKDHEWYRLSLRNCQAIERGYDLDELISESNTSHLALFTSDSHELMYDEGFKAGFQKCLELIGDMKFSEDDMINAHFNAWIDRGEQITYPNSKNRYFKSLQQTEWDVEIEMQCLDPNCDGINKKGECITTGKPKLDADGCLVLKKL